MLSVVLLASIVLTQPVHFEVCQCLESVVYEQSSCYLVSNHLFVLLRIVGPATERQKHFEVFILFLQSDCTVHKPFNETRKIVEM